MLEQLLYLLTALCGFLVLIIISWRYKNNINTNLYFMLFLFLSSSRFLAHGLSNQIPFFAQFLKPIEFLFTVNAWPLLYMYFKKLVFSPKNLKTYNLLHFVTPVLIYLLFFYNVYFTYNANLSGYKIGFIITLMLTLSYLIATYKLLSNTIWKRKSDVYLINQQNNAIKRWSIILYTLFVLMLLRFLINLLLNNKDIWFINQNNYLWVGALIWIVFYIKILYSPEFLYGYEVFESKIKEFKQNRILFDNIWLINARKDVTNLQDIILKKKIDAEIENYILAIEQLALTSDSFFEMDFKPTYLANQLVIPKSHVLYVFKYHANVSFADFRKIIRIQKAIELIKDGYIKNNTMESLSEKVGFISYSNFFKSFKSITGKSPNEYLKS